MTYQRILHPPQLSLPIVNLPSWQISYARVVAEIILYSVVVLIEALLVVRVNYLYTGFNPADPFTYYVMLLTDQLMLPFKGLARGSLADVPYVEWSILVAMQFYALLGLLMRDVMDLVYHRARNPYVRDVKKIRRRRAVRRRDVILQPA